VVIILKFIDLNISIKKDKKETELVEPQHEALRGNLVGRVDDFLSYPDMEDSANIDRNPSKTLTKEDLERLKQKNNDTHKRCKEMKDEVLPLSNKNGTWKRIGHTITKI